MFLEETKSSLILFGLHYHAVTQNQICSQPLPSTVQTKIPSLWADLVGACKILLCVQRTPTAENQRHIMPCGSPFWHQRIFFSSTQAEKIICASSGRLFFCKKWQLETREFRKINNWEIFAECAFIASQIILFSMSMPRVPTLVPASCGFSLLVCDLSFFFVMAPNRSCRSGMDREPCRQASAGVASEEASADSKIMVQNTAASNHFQTMKKSITFKIRFSPSTHPFPIHESQSCIHICATTLLRAPALLSCTPPPIGFVNVSRLRSSHILSSLTLCLRPRCYFVHLPRMNGPTVIVGLCKCVWSTPNHADDVLFSNFGHIPFF